MEPRRTMQDIVFKKDGGSSPESERPRRSIRDITRDRSGAVEMRPEPPPETFAERRTMSDRRQPAMGRESHELREELAEEREPRSFLMWFLAFVSSLVLIIAASTYFYRIKVSITPMQNAVPASEDITAVASGAASGVHFVTAILSQEKDMTVKATGTATVSRKASGQIIIFNSYSTVPQRLIKNTRFETSDGKIYRIDQSIVVPGMTQNGGKQVPGQATATVYADAAGSDYNIDLTDLTIPGFKGDPRYTKIVARSKTSMAGGFVGTEPTVSDADRAAAETTLQSSLHDALIDAVRAQAPQGFFLSDSATTITFAPTTTPASATVHDGEAVIAIEGTIHAALVSSDDLATLLAGKLLLAQGYDATRDLGAVHLLHPEALSITPSGDIPDTQASTFHFTLSGTANFVWDVNTARLDKDLVGTPISNFNNYISTAYPSIKTAEIRRVPFWAFWMNDFPKEQSKITLMVVPPIGQS